MPKVRLISIRTPYYYVVKRGHSTGIFDGWDSFKKQIIDFNCPEFERFDCLEDAKKYEKGETITKESIIPISSIIDDVASTRVIIVYTDGACPNNNTPTSTIASYGIHFPNKELNDVNGLLPDGPFTAPRAELYAVYKLMMLYEQHFSQDERPMKIHTDNQYVANSLNSWCSGWKKKGWKKSGGQAVANLDIMKPLYELYDKFPSVSIEWVKGHAGIEGNEMADFLANQALKQCK